MKKKMNISATGSEFKFYDGVKEALTTFTKKFGKVIIISNQRGVGRQLMTEDDLLEIHRNMQAAIEAAGGRIDNDLLLHQYRQQTHLPQAKPGYGFSRQKGFSRY